MAVAMTCNFAPKQLAVPEKKLAFDKLGLDIEFEWTMHGSGDGDASGGSITGVCDFYTLGKEYYYLITECLLGMADDAYKWVYLESDRWERFYVPGHASRKLLILKQTYPANSYPFVNFEQRYLGRPRAADADAGKVNYEANVNTIGEEYNWFMSGIALNKPISLANLVNLFMS